MLRQIQTFARREGLWSTGDHLLLAVSGGADSICMLHLLHALREEEGLSLSVVHLDHGLRGAESRRDAEFVRDQAEALGLPFFGARRNVKGLADKEGISIEMAARNSRYAYFDEVATQCGAQSIATAHTMDDQAETVLLRLVRGAGAGGLSGIPARRETTNASLIRPMLEQRGDALRNWLMARTLEWREDASNRSMTHLRNRARHQLIPSLKKELNPKAVEAIARSASLLHADEQYLQGVTTNALAAARQRDGSLDGSKIGALDDAIARRVIRGWLADCGVDIRNVGTEAVLDLLRFAGQTEGSAMLRIGCDTVVERRYGSLYLRPLPDDVPVFQYECPSNGTLQVPEAGVKIRISETRKIRRERGNGIGAYPVCATISTARAEKAALMVRSWRAGDRIRPMGMSGSRKLQDVFADAHVPRQERARVPVLACGQEVIYVPGYSVDRRWALAEGEKGLQIQFESL